jgi:hypothetical protein
MYKRLSSILETNNKIYDLQFGFTPKDLISLASIEVNDNVKYHYDNEEYAVGLYLNMQKASDNYH